MPTRVWPITSLQCGFVGAVDQVRSSKPLDRGPEASAPNPACWREERADGPGARSAGRRFRGVPCHRRSTGHTWRRQGFAEGPVDGGVGRGAAVSGAPRGGLEQRCQGGIIETSSRLMG